MTATKEAATALDSLQSTKKVRRKKEEIQSDQMVKVRNKGMSASKLVNHTVLT